MPGPITAGKNLPPVSGNRYPGPIYGGAGFNILDVPDLLRCMLYKANPPYGPQNSLVIVGDPAANGEQVFMVADQILIALQPGAFTEPRDQASNGGEQPIMQADGLQWTQVFQDLTIGNTPIQTGQAEFTAYLWGTQILDNSGWFPLGHNTGGGAIFITENVVNLSDDGFALQSASSPCPGGKVLVRVSVSADGSARITATGGVDDSFPMTFGTFSFNLVGYSTVYGVSGDTGNRHLGQIFVAREIVLNSPEDMNIRLRSVIPPEYAL